MAWRIDRRNKKPLLRRPPPPNNTRRTNGSSGSPTPPWLWLLLLGGFGLIFYQFVPRGETAVQYYPWFFEQVQADNIKSISPQGLDAANCARSSFIKARRLSPR